MDEGEMRLLDVLRRIGSGEGFPYVTAEEKLAAIQTYAQAQVADVEGAEQVQDAALSPREQAIADYAAREARKLAMEQCASLVDDWHSILDGWYSDEIRQAVRDRHAARSNLCLVISKEIRALIGEAAADVDGQCQVRREPKANEPVPSPSQAAVLGLVEALEAIGTLASSDANQIGTLRGITQIVHGTLSRYRATPGQG